MTSSSGGAGVEAGPAGGAAEEDEILPPREPLPHHWSLDTVQAGANRLNIFECNQLYSKNAELQTE